MQSVKLEWDEALLRKYDVSGPRYTSYPTALEFSESYGVQDYIKCLASLTPEDSLSLYIHIPFCQNICYYCACNKVITKDRSKSQHYVESLVKEIKLVANQLATKKLCQIHWGGGTPTFLTMEQIATIMNVIGDCFDLAGDKPSEVSIEVDPRALDIKDIKYLVDLGFNRMSFGVQDFDLQVQKAINRIQSFEMTRDMVAEAKKYGVESINFDLIYGLPKQSLNSFRETLDKVIDISPDRISVFNYAHLPHRFKPQRRINQADLPAAKEKLAIFEYISRNLQEEGYIYIGMDHFAKPTDELAIAQEQGRLYRNFQGYTCHKDYQLIGVGVSSISSVAGHYHQNVRDLNEYYAAIDDEKMLPSWRGVEMTADDRIRKAVIFELICHFKLSKRAIEESYQIDFDSYFSEELKLLNVYKADQLVIVSDDLIQITPRGRLLIRNICMVFDAYLNELHAIRGFSKVI